MRLLGGRARGGNRAVMDPPGLMYSSRGGKYIAGIGISRIYTVIYYFGIPILQIGNIFMFYEGSMRGGDLRSGVVVLVCGKGGRLLDYRCKPFICGWWRAGSRGGPRIEEKFVKWTVFEQCAIVRTAQLCMVMHAHWKKLRHFCQGHRCMQTYGTLISGVFNPSII